jgi:AsmA-like C-terminal region
LTLPHGNVFSTDRITADLKPLAFSHPANSGAITGLRSAQGSLSFEKLKIPGLIDLNLSMEVDGRDDLLSADLTNLSAAASQKGRLTINLRPEEPEWSFHYEVDQMPAEVLVSRFYKGKFLEGTIDYTVDLATRGSDWSAAVQNLDGTLEVRSDSLRIYGLDIDDILRKFQKSQRINLADVGAVVLVGPLGIVATKGSDFVALAATDLNSNQSTNVTKLLTRWQIHQQTLTSEDVAFATTQNRLAFNGSVDFARDSIPGFRVAVVDKNGCSLMDQQLYGKFGDLKAGKLNVAKTLLGSVINFVDVIVGKDCKPIYTGKVAHPKASK